jgi:hypothetical protein
MGTPTLSGHLSSLEAADRRRCWCLLLAVVDVFVHHADRRDLLERVVLAVAGVTPSSGRSKGAASIE